MLDVITQLINTKITPAQYQLRVQHAKLEIKQDFQPEAQIRTTRAQLKQDTTLPTMQIDSSEVRRSLGFQTVSDIDKQSADKAQQSLQEVTQKEVDISRMSAQPNAQTIPQIMHERIKSDAKNSNQLTTVFLPSGGTDISWQPGGVEFQYQPGDVDINWDVSAPEYNYIPGEVYLEMIQPLQVEVEFLGGPLYFPPSADPNYTPPEE